MSTFKIVIARECPVYGASRDDQEEQYQILDALYRHNMYEARSAHARVQRRILIEIGLVAQHQRTHEGLQYPERKNRLQYPQSCLSSRATSV